MDAFGLITEPHIEYREIREKRRHKHSLSYTFQSLFAANMNPSEKPTADQQEEGNKESSRAVRENSPPQNVEEGNVNSDGGHGNENVGGGGVAEGGVDGGAAAAGGKRSHVEVGEQEEQNQPRPRRRGEINIPENKPIKCSVCDKPFASWKAVFGHMRAHQRTWKGAFPPPTFNANEVNSEVVEQELVPELLRIARENLENLGRNQTSALAGPYAAGPSASSAAALREDGLVIDLNQPAADQEKSSDESLDLNRTPADKGSDSAGSA